MSEYFEEQEGVQQQSFNSYSMSLQSPSHVIQESVSHVESLKSSKYCSILSSSSRVFKRQLDWTDFTKVESLGISSKSFV